MPVHAGQQGREGRPHIVDMIKNDEIALVVQHRRGKAHGDPGQLRDPPRGAARPGADYTTLAGARAAAAGMASMRDLVPYSIQALHASL